MSLDSEGEEVGDVAQWKWSELSPYALKSALPEDGARPPEELEERLRWIRLYWWVVLLVFYSMLLLEASTDRELSSATRMAVVDEFFPDWNKAAERMKKGDRSPDLKELLHAEDVAQTLNLYTDRCRMEASLDPGIKDVWSCKLFDVVVQNLGGSEWDPAMNRHLPDADSDNVFGKGKKGVFESKADNRTKERAEERRQEMRQICSDMFFQDHVVIGDDPKKVPWGDVEKFAEKFHLPAAGLHPDFDPFDVRGSGENEMEERIKGMEEKQKEAMQSLERIEQALNQKAESEDVDSFMEQRHTGKASRGHATRDPGTSSFTRLHRRNPWLLEVEQEMAQEKAGAPSLAQLASQAHEPEDLAKPGELDQSQISEREATQKDDEIYGSGCFDSNDVAGLLRDLWVDHKGNGSSGMSKEDAKKMLQEVMPNVTGDNLERLWLTMQVDDQHELSAQEFLNFAEQHLREFQFPVRGYLNMECRNHHFGLIVLCKPAYISVLYQIAFVPSDVGKGPVVNETGTRLHVQMIFTELERNSGWYRAELRIFNKSRVGTCDAWTIFLMLTILFLCLLLTLVDTVMTLVLMPVNVANAVRLDLSRDASYEDIEHELWMKVLKVIDGRGVLNRTLATLTILCERIVAICFVGACVQAARESRRPNSLPMGPMSERCTYAWLRANKDWIIHSISGEYVDHGLSLLTYINECTDLKGMRYFGEMMYQLLFEEECSWHALVVALVFVRVLEFFNLNHRLRWLPRTIFLAKLKLINFVLAYVALVTGFSLLMTLYFGELYQQYSTLQGSFHTLLVYSFGMTERATFGMNPFIERSGNRLYAVLFVFDVFMVTIILNMFTTIVIDAFAAEGDPGKFSKAYQEEITSLTHSLLGLFGKGHIAAWHMRKTIKGTQGRRTSSLLSRETSQESKPEESKEEPKEESKEESKEETAKASD
mmetsp:Transcript_40181/g.92970  ORF Transcript_40181/g.92970 Transcript_40181/m.92970 type:complete len:937 (+) Transcript_40181:63-2873(+)